MDRLPPPNHFSHSTESRDIGLSVYRLQSRSHTWRLGVTWKFQVFAPWNRHTHTHSVRHSRRYKWTSVLTRGRMDTHPHTHAYLLSRKDTCTRVYFWYCCSTLCPDNCLLYPLSAHSHGYKHFCWQFKAYQTEFFTHKHTAQFSVGKLMGHKFCLFYGIHLVWGCLCFKSSCCTVAEMILALLLSLSSIPRPAQTFRHALAHMNTQTGNGAHTVHSVQLH